MSEYEEQDYEYWETDEDEWDRVESAISECYFMPEEGYCMIAGTEHCDWGCPFSRWIYEEDNDNTTGEN